MRIFRRLALLATLLTLAAGVLWYVRDAGIPEVTVVTPIRGKAVHAVYATGVVEPVHWARVTPLVRGRIAEICACEGKRVMRGAFLVRLESGEEEAAYTEVEAEARYLEEELKRQRDLFARKVASAATYERALSTYTKALAALAAARERLEDLQLRAPLDGVVLRQDGEVGEVVEPGQVLFWVGQPEPLWIEAAVDEEDIPLVAAGQRVVIKADAFSDQVLEGTVERITPKGDPLNKSYRVRIALPADSPLLIGMTTEANILVRTVDDALLVPTASLRGNALWVVEGGLARRMDVEVGVRGDDRSQVTAGVDGTTQVIVDPGPDLAAGQRVSTVRGGRR
ncbi:MAG: efflux RND transporter periplasmic adaptor subunit [Acetobacterales bacterium]